MSSILSSMLSMSSISKTNDAQPTSQAYLDPARKKVFRHPINRLSPVGFEDSTTQCLSHASITKLTAC